MAFPNFALIPLCLDPTQGQGDVIVTLLNP